MRMIKLWGQVKLKDFVNNLVKTISHSLISLKKPTLKWEQYILRGFTMCRLNYDLMAKGQNVI